MQGTEQFDLERAIASLSIRSALIGTAILIVLLVAGAIVRKHIPKLKFPLFMLIVGTVLATTTILAVSTVYLNVNSSSKGPVHWHADFQIWACDKQLDLRGPQGFLSNKIGTASLHEHNDERIHLEGVVVQPRDASLGKFFRVVGGELNEQSMVVPLEDNGQAKHIDGEKCPDGSTGDVQVFVYSVNGETKTYSQRKLENPEDYVMRDASQVPPGDCFIIEFGPTRDRTDHKCLQYQVQDEELHNYQEVTSP